jgi:hypothetical protein
MTDKEPRSDSGRFYKKGSKEYWSAVGQILRLAGQAVAEEEKINETVKARAKALRQGGK